MRPKPNLHIIGNCSYKARETMYNRINSILGWKPLCKLVLLKPAGYKVNNNKNSQARQTPKNGHDCDGLSNNQLLVNKLVLSCSLGLPSPVNLANIDYKSIKQNNAKLKCTIVAVALVFQVSRIHRNRIPGQLQAMCLDLVLVNFNFLDEPITFAISGPGFLNLLIKTV